MTHEEMVALLRGGITQPGGTWADFGAGTGNFTASLRELLGAEAVIYAIDRDGRALERLQARRTEDGRGSAYRVIQADFTTPLDLPPLDGVLLANALHFVRKPIVVLQRIAGYLRPGGRLLLVEYDVRMPRSYIPHPIDYGRFEKLAAQSGFVDVARVGERRSPSTGIVMYAGMATQKLR